MAIHPIELVTASSPTDGVRLITLNRPQKRNALSQDLIRQLLIALLDASHDETVYAIIVTGNGNFFCAGADLNDIAALDATSAKSTRYLEDLCLGLAAAEKPIIAAVNGPALGGGFEIALMSDIIVSSKSAYFCFPETKIGLIPGAGGTQRLTSAVGKFRAMQSILLAAPISADEAKQMGLVIEVAEDDAVGSALRVAAKLAGNKEAVKIAKKAICRADDLCRDDGFERDLYYDCFGTAEKHQCVNKFLKKN